MPKRLKYLKKNSGSHRRHVSLILHSKFYSQTAETFVISTKSYFLNLDYKMHYQF
jgi:hypothetical protein